jgi:hypothetical protein
MPWEAVVELLLGEGGPSDPHALCRRDVLRTLIDRVRAADFPYQVFPVAHDDDPARLELYPGERYDFDCGFGWWMWFDVRTKERTAWSREVRGDTRRVDAYVTVTHIFNNDRLDTYEKRSWEVPPKFLFELLPAFFEEVAWPRNNGREGWFASQLPEKIQENLKENHGKEET